MFFVFINANPLLKMLKLFSLIIISFNVSLWCSWHKIACMNVWYNEFSHTHIYLWNSHYHQDNKHFHYSQKFPCALCSSIAWLKIRSYFSLFLLLFLFFCHYPLVCICENFMSIIIEYLLSSFIHHTYFGIYTFLSIPFESNSVIYSFLR